MRWMGVSSDGRFSSCSSWSRQWLPSVWQKSITWTNADLLSIGPFKNNLSAIWIEIKNLFEENSHGSFVQSQWCKFVQPWRCWGVFQSSYGICCVYPIMVFFMSRSGAELESAQLTHLPLVAHICISESSQHWFRYWLVACMAPSHYLNQCWLIVNWTLRNKLQWNFNQNKGFFIHEVENASENIVCEMAAILSKGRWVNITYITPPPPPPPPPPPHTHTHTHTHTPNIPPMLEISLSVWPLCSLLLCHKTSLDLFSLFEWCHLFRKVE